MRERLRELGCKRSGLIRCERTARLVLTMKPGRVLDAGGHSPLRQLLIEQGVEVEGTDEFDLRTSCLGSDKYDLALCTEVLEHLRDQDESPVDCWCYSGMLHCLRELRRVATRLLLTTPNGTSLRSIRRLLNGAHAHEYDAHVREVSPERLRRLLRKTGWQIDRLWTEDDWGGVPTLLGQRIMKLCNRSGLRGDVLYAICS